MAAEADKVLTVVKSVIFYHAEPESGTSNFAGSKERVRIGIRGSHKILSVFLRYVTSFCGIKEECIKCDLGGSLAMIICRLVGSAGLCSKNRVLCFRASPVIGYYAQNYARLEVLCSTS